MWWTSRTPRRSAALELAEPAGQEDPVTPRLPDPGSEVHEDPAVTPAQVVSATERCATAANGTGRRCMCGFRCANYVLREHGFRSEDPGWVRPVPR